MRPLYLSSAVREGLGPCLRPGGTVLTRRIIDLLQPDDNCTILDAGCGTGASMALIKQHGFATVFGIDVDSGLLSEAGKTCQTVIRGDLARLPLADREWDIILCECTWNLTEKEQVLKEFARVLKPGGMLAMTDIYTRGVPARQAGTWPIRCCFSAATDLATVNRQVTAAGFTVTTLEDHTPLLKQTAAEFVFAHGSLQKFWQAVTGNCADAAAACTASAASRPGLFLLLAQRNTTL